jgi:Zn-dependent alcohol dehydrogenase
LDGTNALRGGVRGHFFGQSSFASRNLATGRNLVKATKSLSLELLAPLGCGLQTGAGTVMTTLAVCAGSSFAVYGAGSVGLAAVMAAMLCQSQNDHRGVISIYENHIIAFSCLYSVRQETPDFFPGWRLMNLGLDAFVPATIQNSS